ncbi:MAG: hypothetical protein ACKVZJ_06390 [Phycisphaerales bacterium]
MENKQNTPEPKVNDQAESVPSPESARTADEYRRLLVSETDRRFQAINKQEPTWVDKLVNAIAVP